MVSQDIQNDQIFKSFSPGSRIWIYTCNKAISNEKQELINRDLQEFSEQWNAHGMGLNNKVAIYEDSFLIFAVDEEKSKASGCSIDSSVHFVKKLERKYNLEFFDRFRYVYINDNSRICNVSKAEFIQLYRDNIVSENTIVFDPLVKSVEAFRNNFKKELKNSWHYRFID